MEPRFTLFSLSLCFTRLFSLCFTDILPVVIIMNIIIIIHSLLGSKYPFQLFKTKGNFLNKKNMSTRSTCCFLATYVHLKKEIFATSHETYVTCSPITSVAGGLFLIDLHKISTLLCLLFFLNKATICFCMKWHTALYSSKDHAAFAMEGLCTSTYISILY